MARLPYSLISDAVLFLLTTQVFGQCAVTQKLFRFSPVLANGAKALGVWEENNRLECFIRCSKKENCVGLIVTGKNNSAWQCTVVGYVGLKDVTLPLGANLYIWADGLKGCNPNPCQNSQPCVADPQLGYKCMCTVWEFDGRHCEVRFTFLIQHKVSGLYLTEIGVPDNRGHCPAHLLSSPNPQSYWQEYKKNPSDPYIFYEVEGKRHYMLYSGSIRTKNGPYGAERFYPTQIIAQNDALGRREVRLRNHWSGNYIGAYDPGSGYIGTSVSSSSSNGVWYFIHAPRP